MIDHLDQDIHAVFWTFHRSKLHRDLGVGVNFLRGGCMRILYAMSKCKDQLSLLEIEMSISVTQLDAAKYAP